MSSHLDSNRNMIWTMSWFLQQQHCGNAEVTLILL